MDTSELLWAILDPEGWTAEREKKRDAIEKDDSLDEDGWPKRWSDPTYLGDGPYGP